MRYSVVYVPRGKKGHDTATVTVDQDSYDKTYTATNLRLWGCGKRSATPEGAIRLLVQDMATIVSIQYDGD